MVVVWIKSLAAALRCSFCSGSKSCGTNFAMTCFMVRSCIKISDTVVFGIPRSASSSHTVSRRSLLIAAHTHSTFSDVLLVGRPSRTWITFNTFLSMFETFVPHFYLHCTHCIVPKSLLNHLSSFHGGMLKLNAKFDMQIVALLAQSFWTWGSYTIHAHSAASTTATDLYSEVVFVHNVHSSPLPLAARLHWYCVNYSSYINSGWTFSGQTS